MDENQLYNLLMEQYNNSQPAQDYISAASANINNLARQRARKLQSQYATTGLGRSGIGGAAMNDIYSTAGQNLSQVAAQGEQMRAQERQNALHSLLGLYEFNQQNNPSFGQVLGGIGGSLAGSLLGPAGAAIGGGLGSKLAGLIGGDSQSGRSIPTDVGSYAPMLPTPQLSNYGG